MDLKELKKADAKMETFFLTAKYFLKKQPLLFIRLVSGFPANPRRCI